MNRKTFTCGYCFAFVSIGEECGCKDAQFDRANARIKELEGVLRPILVEYPCKHEPETYFFNVECGYCKLYIEANKVLRS